VAIKILPDAFSQDAVRMASFEREAQVLAALNHPNIAAIYGVEDRALIMELVEGPTLAERIHAFPVPLDEAVSIARQITEALEYAHEKGIVHRDLKPANIKVTPDGRVKVLDFGLAKALTDGSQTPASAASSPTLTMRGATVTGVIMGTTAYMAPEQARGQAVDKRADIWAFGVVLYEMLTGRPLFSGPTVSDTLAGVLKEEPDWKLIPWRLQNLILHGAVILPWMAAPPLTPSRWRNFESALKRAGKHVESGYFQKAGHNAFFTDAAQAMRKCDASRRSTEAAFVDTGCPFKATSGQPG